MDADGLALVKFAQNELQDMRYIFQSAIFVLNLKANRYGSIISKRIP